jgi:AraC family transcriptional regulator
MKQQIRSEYIDQVQAVIDSLLERLDTASDWSSVASQAFCSPFHFHQIFRRLTGETALEMRRRCRLERAAYQLKYTDKSVGDVSIVAGFSSHEAFTRAFRVEFGSSPQEWRQSASYEYRLTKANGIHYRPNREDAHFMPCDSGEQTMEVEIKELETIRLGAIRHVGPYPQISSKFGMLFGLTQRYGLSNSAFIALYYSSPDECPEHELQSDACVVVASTTDLPEELTERVIPAGKYAVHRFTGNYSHLGDVWQRFLGEWLPTSGYVPTQTPCFEWYMNDCMVVGMDNAITDLYIGVQ